MSSLLYAVIIFKLIVLLEDFSSQFNLKKSHQRYNLPIFIILFLIFLQKLSINCFNRFLEDFQKKYYLSVDM